MACLVIEFLAMMVMGYSVMYKKVNTVQLLLHGLGVLGGVWMLLEGWHYSLFFAMAVPFGLVPVVLELAVVRAVLKFDKIERHIESQLKEEISYRKALDERRRTEMMPQ